ncbi:organic hydroperoxide resistance protein [Pyxidicoccus fallax]|uniref:Organic hydroperoxide resistance protein n=1 Tax=Pyxidicoccus fallax TaxID=394095 RepID=A0A848LHU5_9BACT|nr:organic hydroperoxide resistance protein [Pyxidicoccus fallax]NMO16498.1 organic hydroperoxide resistance protein [Pyxidicoccus fallax]NPC77440.1 organic hydroperoxide resistance protein [Pyxidicoccus fallax]
MATTPVATPLYTTTATAHGGRSGHVKSTDGVIDLQLAMPKEMGGPGGAKANPETLFAAGYAACFEGALRLVARTQGKTLGDGVGITASVTIGKTPDGGFGLAVDLKGILPGMPREEAQKLMEDAHKVCPYSRATQGNIDVKVSVAQ